MATQTQKNVSFPTVISLNVGGQMYTTSLSTLTKYSESMLGAMFSGRFAAQQDSNRNYFIDRDGALFRYVLSFLRNGELHVPENFNEFGLLLKEAEFYQIPALIQTVKQQMKGQGGHKGHKQDEEETIMVLGRTHGDVLNAPIIVVSSVSGRLRTLMEMFHIAGSEDEGLKITPYTYADKSEQSFNERMGKMTLELRHRILPEAVFEVAQSHGFKKTESYTYKRRFIGDAQWILSRK